MTAERAGRGPFRQQLPEPAGAVPVRVPDAAFASFDAGEIASLSTWPVLRRAFPGGELDRPRADPPEEERDLAAAVLVALMGEETGGAPTMVLIRRSTRLRQNPGEIAFPGGRIEAGESATETALREAFEEVALPARAVRVIGALPPVRRGLHPGAIAAVVGTTAELVELEASSAEVEEILVVELAKLADGERYWEELWPSPAGDLEMRRMHFFDLGDDVVWGASARILVSFLQLLATAVR